MNGMQSLQRCSRQPQRQEQQRPLGIPAITGILEIWAASPTAWARASPQAQLRHRSPQAPVQAQAEAVHPAAVAGGVVVRGGDLTFEFFPHHFKLQPLLFSVGFFRLNGGQARHDLFETLGIARKEIGVG